MTRPRRAWLGSWQATSRSYEHCKARTASLSAPSSGVQFTVSASDRASRLVRSSETEMNAYLRHQFSLDELDSSISEMHARTHLPITFTHGDLLPRNIMYHDGAITAIIDWENAGWYPAHWEYIKARFGLTHYEKLWAPWIPKYLEEYAEEWLADARLSSVAWWITGCD